MQNSTSWDRLVLPYWWQVVEMVILLSTRGTAGSDIWFTCLADKPMVRCYHPTLPLPTFSLSLVVTSHLVLEVFTRQLLLSGIVCRPFLRNSHNIPPTPEISSFPFSLCHCLATHLSASDSFTTTALYKSIYLLTDLPTSKLILVRRGE